MGDKGGKLSQDASAACENVVEILKPIGDVTSKKMFGGYGIFESGAMFALVNSQGQVHLKVDDSNQSRFETAGSEKHGRMPYYQVPAEVLGDDDLLIEWARISIDIAHAAKK